MSSSEPEPRRLGSLAKSARHKHLNQIRATLFVIGALTILVNIFAMINLRSEVQKELDLQAPQAGGMKPANPQFVEAAVLIGYVINGAFCLMGALFVLFGFLVKLYPVPITIISLVLYILGALVSVVLNPASLVVGIVVKVIIIIAFVKAIQTAIAYQREETEAADLEPEFE